MLLPLILILLACSAHGSTEENVLESFNDKGEDIIMAPMLRSSKNKKCKTMKGVKLVAGETHTDDNGEWVCEDMGNYMVLRPISCAHQGLVIKIGEIYIDNGFYRQCIKESSEEVVHKIVGCVVLGGAMAHHGKEFTRHGFVYFCGKNGTESTVTAVSCADSSGGSYQVGDKWLDGNQYFVCEAGAEGVLLRRLVACVDSDRNTLKLGDLFILGDIVYKCEIDSDSLALKIAGCYTRTGDVQQIGAKWYEKPKARLSVLMMCRSTGTRVSIQMLECVYHHPSGNRYVPTNCAADMGTEIFICSESGGVLAMPAGTTNKKCTLLEKLKNGFKSKCLSKPSTKMTPLEEMSERFNVRQCQPSSTPSVEPDTVSSTLSKINFME